MNNLQNELDELMNEAMENVESCETEIDNNNNNNIRK